MALFINGPAIGHNVGNILEGFFDFPDIHEVIVPCDNIAMHCFYKKDANGEYAYMGDLRCPICDSKVFLTMPKAFACTNNKCKYSKKPIDIALKVL
jgi:hypothetical protein